MTVVAIDHVQLPVPEGRDAALRTFYGRLIGLRDRSQPGSTTLRFETGFQRVDLVPVPSLALPAWIGHLALRVSGIASLRERLREAGYRIDESRPLPGHDRFSVEDPAGNRLEVIEPLEDAA